MSRNVWEFCSDWFGVFSNDQQTNPLDQIEGSRKVIRGDSWANSEKAVRVSYRSSFIPDVINFWGGFRLVLPED